MTTAVEPTQVPLQPPVRLFAAPGVLFYLATLIAIVIAVDANSRDSFSAFLLAAPLWLLLAGIWAAWFALALASSGPRLPLSRWVRWLAIPFVMGLVFYVTRIDVLFDARLSLSRTAMDQMAAEVMAGGTLERGWVGLYDAGQVERLGNGLRFVIDDSGLYRLGFAYAPTGVPAQSTVEDSGLWTGAEYEPLGGGWWLWTESWD